MKVKTIRRLKLLVIVAIVFTGVGWPWGLWLTRGVTLRCNSTTVEDAAMNKIVKVNWEAINTNPIPVYIPSVTVSIFKNGDLLGKLEASFYVRAKATTTVVAQAVFRGVGPEEAAGTTMLYMEASMSIVILNFPYYRTYRALTNVAISSSSSPLGRCWPAVFEYGYLFT